MAKRVKEGDIVTIGGISYTFGETSAQAFNALMEGAEKNRFPVERFTATIHLYRADGEGGGSFTLKELIDALG